MKVSIIVPVYNVENYIYKCVESLLGQTIDDFEVIIVNDGTQDRSIDIVKSFNDERIKIIFQENSGLSAARNTGIQHARGEYILFVDSDDYIGDRKCIKEMYDIAILENSDIVAGNCIWYYDDNNKYKMERDMDLFSVSPMKSEEFFKKSLKSKRIYAPVWLNLYKKSLLVDNDLFFRSGIYHEDEEFTPRALLSANLVSIYNNEFYIYRQRQGSITNSNGNSKKGTDIIEIFSELILIADTIQDCELRSLFKKYLVSLCIDSIYKYKINNISEKVKILLINNSISYGQRMRSLLINSNINMFINLENIFRKVNRN